MNYFSEMIHNHVLVSAALGWCVAQVLKTIIHLIINKKFVPERLVGSGGMPSSHSATVCALATATLMDFGPASFEFAIAFVVAMIVMYDARGVRLETGKQAQVLNQMMDAFKTMGNNIPYEQRLKEFVGHTMNQVAVGAVLGIIIAIIICNVL